MVSVSPPQPPEALNVAQPAGAEGRVMLRFAPEFAGATGIVAGLRSLAAGTSARETWLIARDEPDDHSQQIFGRLIVARATLEGWVSWRYCDVEGDPFGEDSRPLVPDPHPQELDLACAVLAAHLYRLADQHRAEVFRVDPTAPAAVEAPVLPFPQRMWRRIATRERTSTPVTSASLRERLCREQQLTPEAADRLMEAHACSSGLLRIGEDWYTCESRLLLPPVGREDYARIVRSLRRHVKDCEVDRVRHAALGNHGAARALASEVAASRRTLELISSMTQELA